MKKLLLSAVAAAGIFAGSFSVAHAAPETYDFDKTHTSILFFIDHLGFSMVQGEFHGYEGQFVFDAANPAASSVEVSIETRSVDTDVEALDTHLRNADFFNVEQFPTMTFKSTGIEVTGDNTGKITGDLTLLGVTKPVTLDVVLNKAGEHPFTKAWTAGFSATGTLNRSEFGMNWGVPAIGDEVQIRIETEGTRR